MTKKPVVSSAGEGNRRIAMEALKKKQKDGTVPTDDTVLSIADHGNVIIVYTQHTSFGVVKNAKSSKTG